MALAGCQSDVSRIRGTNQALSTPVPDTLSAEINSLEIQDGDCINSTLPEGISIETVVIVPCSGTWQYRVLGSFEVEDTDQYPGEGFYNQRALKSCDRRSTYFLYPLAESWELGHREINCLQESFGLSHSDPSKLDRLVGGTYLKSGECFNEALETDGVLVELVDCSSDWQFRVLSTFNIADSDQYPGEDFFFQQALESCHREYTNYFFPPSESWSLGNRKVTCLQEQT